MKLAIKQPYLFPYIGYFQVINIVDKYILFDDVNYINKGLINRNRLLVNKREYLYTVPLINASQNKLINEIYLTTDNRWNCKFLKTIETAYKKAPMFKIVYPMIESIINIEERNLSAYIYNSIKQICDYLGIETPIIPSSVSYNTKHLKGQDKILEICRQEDADIYIDTIGATELYKQDAFGQYGMRLLFLKSKPIEYIQFGEDFIPYLSIIDIIMFNEKEEVSQFLNNYEFV